MGVRQSVLLIRPSGTSGLDRSGKFAGRGSRSLQAEQHMVHFAVHTGKVEVFIVDDNVYLYIFVRYPPNGGKPHDAR